jgi:DNA-binding beta-propeller fold protein YncE
MRNFRICLLALTLIATPALAQVINSYAGGAAVSPEGQPATSVALQSPQAIATDAAGSLYIADFQGHRLYKVTAGTMHILLDGGSPVAVAVDGTTAYVARGVSSANTVERLDASSGAVAGSFTGGGGTPLGMLVDGANLWMALGASTGSTGSVVKVEAATGAIVGLPGVPAGGWGPRALAKDATGNVYVTDGLGSRIYKYTNGVGTPVSIAGTGTAGLSGDGAAATAAALNQPVGIAVDAAGNIFFADKGNNRVRRIDVTSGNISTIAGGGTGGDGAATSARLVGPHGLAFVGAALYVSEEGARRVRKIEAGNITTVAGGPLSQGDGGLATSAPVESPSAIAFDTAGNAFIAEIDRVRRVTPALVVSTFAGSGFTANAGADGDIATTVTLAPAGVAVDASGNVYVTDATTATVRKVDAAAGTISRFAGNSTAGEGGDGGAAKDASLTTTSLAAGPRGLAIASGQLYVAAGSRVRKVDLASGIITTVAGGGATTTPADGSAATSADLGTPVAVAVDSAGNLLVVAYRGQVSSTLYRVTAGTGLISTIMTRPWSSRITGVAVDSGGNIFVPAGSSIVLRIGADGRVLIVAGTGQPGASTEGTFANVTSFGNAPAATPPPLALAIGAGGHLYIAAADLDRVYRVTLAGIMASPPVLTMSGRLPGTTSLPVPVLLTQLGASPATINSITPPANFAVSHDCGATLAAFTTCTASVTFTPPSVATFTGNVDVNASVVAQDFSVEGAGETTLVTHYYESILRRPPDSGGKPFWDSERARLAGLGASVNETWFAMSSFFFASAEYTGFNRDNPGFVTDLYLTFFNRAPDSGGLQFWVDQMASGMPREVVLAQFQHSPEFASFTQGIFGSTAARAEVNMVMDFYRGLLGRLPDNGGFNNWVGAFRAAQCQGAAQVAATAEQISQSFTGSTEYASRNRTNAQFVGDLYNAFLRRGGDLNGVLFWIGRLDSQAMTREQVRSNFAASGEFQGRVSAVANAGCLP